jgi:excisionase family DNA binding protein
MAKTKNSNQNGKMLLVEGLDTRLCLNVPEAAKMLGVSRNFCYDLVKQGLLPVVRFGRRILIPKAALMKMLEQAKGSVV